MTAKPRKKASADFFGSAAKGPSPLEVRAFFTAARDGDARAIEKLAARYPVLINQKDFQGDTPLILAAFFNHGPVVKELLKAGADLDVAEDFRSRTALMHAAAFGYADIVADLIKAGAKLELRDREGKTALLNAADTENPAALKKLIRAGADVFALDDDGNSALILACRRFHDENVKCLLDQKLDPNHRNNDGNTALHFSVLHEDKSLIATLIRAGADLDIANHEGQTPRAMAREKPLIRDCLEKAEQACADEKIRQHEKVQDVLNNGIVLDQNFSIKIRIKIPPPRP